MGCCFSLPRGPNSPYPGAAHSATGSARAINSPLASPRSHALPAAAQPAESASSAGDHHRSPRARRHRRPLDQHINKPLRRHQWASTDRLWSRSALDRERSEFFDTRVTGHAEIWQSINAALELLWAARVAAGDDDDDDDATHETTDNHPDIALATAQSILDAADITLPSGDLADGAYDALGNLYQIPPHVVSDPVNLVVSDGQIDGTIGESKHRLAGGHASTTGAESDGDDDEESQDAQRRREEKGKGSVDVASQLPLVTRISDSSRDLKFHIGKHETVRSIARRILDETGRRPGYAIRIAYMGKIMRESASLPSQGWQPGQVINAFVYQPLS